MRSLRIYMGMGIKMSYLPPPSSFFSPSPETAWPESQHFVLLLSIFLFVMAVCISFLFHFMSHLYNHLRALYWSSFMQYSPHSRVFMSEKKLQLRAHWTWQIRTSFTMEIGNHFISGPTYADYFQTVLVHVLANFHPYHNGWRKLVTLRCYVLLIRKHRSTLLFLPQAFQCRDAEWCFPNTQLSPALTVKKWKTNNQTKKLKEAGKGELANKAVQKIFPDYYYY